MFMSVRQMMELGAKSYLLSSYLGPFPLLPPPQLGHTAPSGDIEGRKLRESKGNEPVTMIAGGGGEGSRVY